jgi:hypothetical protein
MAAALRMLHCVDIETTLVILMGIRDLGYEVEIFV